MSHLRVATGVTVVCVSVPSGLQNKRNISGFVSRLAVVLSTGRFGRKMFLLRLYCTSVQYKWSGGKGGGGSDSSETVAVLVRVFILTGVDGRLTRCGETPARGSGRAVGRALSG